MPRLLDHLKTQGWAASQARRLLAGGKVFYRGIPTADEGREVDEADVSVNESAAKLQPNRDPALIHRDAHLVIVWKPPGLLSVPNRSRAGERSVLGYVRGVCGSAYAVHRLDLPTSGLMMVALTESCQTAIKELLFGHRIERRYMAIVRGVFASRPRTVRSHIIRDRGDGLRGSIQETESDDDNAKEAITHLRLLEPLGTNASLVEAKLETGRTHQARIHLAEGKHPILGDDLYGGIAAGRAAPRLALHAYFLGLRHPITSEKIALEAPLADDLEVLRRKLIRRSARAKER